MSRGGLSSGFRGISVRGRVTRGRGLSPMDRLNRSSPSGRPSMSTVPQVVPERNIFQGIGTEAGLEPASAEELRVVNGTGTGLDKDPTTLALKRNRPAYQFDNLVPVTVKVGEARKEFKAWKSFLTSVSDYFSNAFGEPWKEGQENSIELAEVSESTFTIFLEWVYTRKITFPKDLVGAFDLSYARLVDAYIFADQYMVPGLKASILSHMRWSNGTPADRLITGQMVTRAVENLQDHDPLFNALVKMFLKDTLSLKRKRTDEEMVEYSPLFLWKVIETADFPTEPET